MARIFVYDGRELVDPDPNLSIEQVQSALADFYPELGNARHTHHKRGEDDIYEFQRVAGTKGAGA